MRGNVSGEAVGTNVEVALGASHAALRAALSALVTSPRACAPLVRVEIVALWALGFRRQSAVDMLAPRTNIQIALAALLCAAVALAHVETKITPERHRRLIVAGRVGEQVAVSALSEALALLGIDGAGDEHERRWDGRNEARHR